MTRRIIHVDMDEFFAAVEKLDRPELRGRPILVGGDPARRGVVSTASYEARAFGCHSAMPMAQAIRLCPQAIVLPVRGRRYSAISEQVLEILERFTPLVEPLSIDEAFLDVTGSQRLFGPAEEIARRIKATVRGELGLSCSLGLASNKFLAKLASDLRKPDGLVVITEESIHETLDPLPVTKLWGVGSAADKVFQRLGIRTIEQVRKADPAALAREFGASGEHLWRLANGLDDRPVVTEGQARSVGQETTFAEDVADMDELRATLMDHVERVGRRLRKHALSARTVTVKLRYGDFKTITRATTLDQPTDLTDPLWRAAAGLVDKWATEEWVEGPCFKGGMAAVVCRHAPSSGAVAASFAATSPPSGGAKPSRRSAIRLIGMTASNLSGREGRQMALFEEPSATKHRRLDSTLDEIARRYGARIVRRGK